MRLIVAMICTSLVGALASSVLAAGTIDIQTTGFDNYVVINVIVDDRGGVGSCNGFFTLTRATIPECTTETIGTFAREPGVVSTHQFFDAPLPASRAHRYEVIACSGFTWLHDCGYGLSIEAVAHTTPAPAYLGTGRLDGNFTFNGCPGECSGAVFHALPTGGWQYVGTGQNVALYGTYTPDCAWGHVVTPTQVVPTECTVATEPTTWSGAKRLYR